jgi:phage gpG-like protein
MSGACVVVKISGYMEHLSRLKNMTGPEVVEQVGAVLLVGAQMIQTTAQISITTGAVGGKNHVPSKPGTPPNSDTGFLANNIEAVLEGPLKATVTANGPYARIQEFGGVINHPGGTPYFMRKDGMAVFVSKQGYGAFHNLPLTKPHEITLPARPYMRPAAQAKKADIKKLMAKAVSKIIRGGKVTGSGKIGD